MPYLFSSGFRRQGSQSDQPVERVSCEHQLDVVGLYSVDVVAMIRDTIKGGWGTIVTFSVSSLVSH